MPLAYSEDLAAPLKQVKDGILPEQVVCSEGLVLGIKKSDNTPACVTPGTLQKLVIRGWAIDLYPTDKAGILVDTFTITLGDNGNTVELYSGDRLDLNLSTKYTWKINVDNDTVLKRVSNQIPSSGSQGIYESLEPGMAILSATGTQICSQETQSCDAPEINFILHVVVL